MTGKNSDPESNDHRVGALLDAALAHYSAAEPRAGLEERILTAMRLRERPVRRYGWLPIAMAVAIAFLAIPSYFVWRDIDTHPGDTPPGTRPDTQPAREPVAGNAVTPRRNEDLRQRDTTPPVELGRTVNERAVRASAFSPVRAPKRRPLVQEISTELLPKSMAKAVAGPRQDRFPADSPLTQQEILLARYAELAQPAASVVASPIKDLEIEALNVAPIAIDQPEK